MSQITSSNESPNTTTETTPPNNSNVLEWSYSGKAMRLRFFLYLILSLLAIGGVGYAYFAKLISDNILVYSWFGVAILVVLLWVNFYVTYFYRVWTIKYKLENNCLYSYKGLFVQKRDALELMYISDLQLVRTLFDIIFNGGVGKLIIFSSADKTDSKLVITGVANPHHVLEVLNKNRTKLREQRGFISGDSN
ncbi:MAG: hypothetical protein LBJ00_10400 [Planctomycetaceae bacterium]|nr:hypothetical protein [Planctomycetaceae bacterium]